MALSDGEFLGWLATGLLSSSPVNQTADWVASMGEDDELPEYLVLGLRDGTQWRIEARQLHNWERLSGRPELKGGLLDTQEERHMKVAVEIARDAQPPEMPDWPEGAPGEPFKKEGT